jgi:hypothetical protein
MFQGAKRPRDEMPWFALTVTVLIFLSFPLSGLGRKTSATH